MLLNKVDRSCAFFCPLVGNRDLLKYCDLFSLIQGMH